MTNKQHPITPSSELVQQWREESSTGELHFSPQYLATCAAQWGADQELQACINFIYDNELCDPNFYKDLRAARRSKPPSLKEQALDQLSHVENRYGVINTDYIRRALEQLPE